MKMELITLTESNNCPTLSMGEIDTLVSNLRFTILPNGQAVTDFIELNYDTIIESMDISENSKATYKKNGKEFLNFIKANGFDIDTYRKFKTFLLNRTDTSQNWKSNKLIVAKAILSNLNGHRRILTIDITNNVKGIKTKQEHKYGLNDSEITSVKNYIDSMTNSAKRTRLKCMFSLLTMQGLRQFEITNLTVQDINLKDAKAEIKGKGNIEQDIKLHPETVKAIKEYLNETGKKSGYLFTSEKGTTTGEQLTERGFRKIWNTVFDALDIDRSTHGFRHFFVTKMLEATNGNTGIVKQFSRHKNIITVNRYDDRRIKEQHDKIFFQAFQGI